MNRAGSTFVIALLAALVAVCVDRLLGWPASAAGNASDPPKVVAAQQFKLVDSQGRARGGLSCGDDGSFLLLMQGESVVLAKATAEGAVIRLGDDPKKPAVLMASEGDASGAFVHVSSTSGTVTVESMAPGPGRPVGGAHLKCSDPDGRVRLSAGMARETAGIALFTPQAKPYWSTPFRESPPPVGAR